jgi:hypothetical protein
VTTDVSKVELKVPRDRNASLEPVTVPKRGRRLEGLSAQVISLYAKDMSTGDIQAHLAVLYGTDISRDTLAGPEGVKRSSRLVPRWDSRTAPSDRVAAFRTLVESAENPVSGPGVGA